MFCQRKRCDVHCFLAAPGPPVRGGGRNLRRASDDGRNHDTRSGLARGLAVRLCAHLGIAAEREKHDGCREKALGRSVKDRAVAATEVEGVSENHRCDAAGARPLHPLKRVNLAVTLEPEMADDNIGYEIEPFLSG